MSTSCPGGTVFQFFRSARIPRAHPNTPPKRMVLRPQRPQRKRPNAERVRRPHPGSAPSLRRGKPNVMAIDSYRRDSCNEDSARRRQTQYPLPESLAPRPRFLYRAIRLYACQPALFTVLRSSSVPVSFAMAQMIFIFWNSLHGDRKILREPGPAMAMGPALAPGKCSS